MTLDQLNDASTDQAETEFLKCCGSRRWADAMAAARPFENEEQMFVKADEVLSALTDDDWLEAFRAHPKIGEKKAATAQSQQEQSWSAQEQSTMQAASTNIVAQLRERNSEYEAKFGFIFIICASGKQPEEILAVLNDRMKNDPQTELLVAAEQQKRITRLRLEKLLNQ